MLSSRSRHWLSCEPGSTGLLGSSLWSWWVVGRRLAWIELFGHRCCFAKLLDNPVALAPLDAPLHVRDEMLPAGGDHEMSRIRANRLVLLRRQRDPRGAFLGGALAEPVRQRHPEIVRLVDVVDALVDSAKQRLILCSSSLIQPRWRRGHTR